MPPKLPELLVFLEREDVSEVLLQTDSPPCVMMGGQVRPLSKTTLSVSDLHEIAAGTVASDAVRRASDEKAYTADFSLDGKGFCVTSFVRQGRLQLRFARRAASVVSATASASARPNARGPAADADAGLLSLLATARERRASDVHLSSGKPAMVRVGGELVPLGDPIPHERLEAMVLPILDSSHRGRLEKEGYADTAAEVDGAGRFRVNINRHRDGLKGCFRLTPPSPIPLAELGLPPELATVTRHHQGLVVISGPNGSGKSTTLASLVDVFNSTKPIHIITVEDPVEILHSRKKAVVSQREVGSHTKSFASALKGALREDPDVIAIGELRDLETVEMALSAAETGHLVLATMSTPSGARTIDRLIDMFPPGVQNQVRATLAGTLKMVISQRLIPNADKTARHAAAELITGNIPLWAMIRDNKLYQLQSLLQRGRAYGMIRIDDSINELLSKGLVTLETARLFADDPKSIGPKESAEGALKPSPSASAEKKTAGIGQFFGKRGE